MIRSASEAWQRLSPRLKSTIVIAVAIACLLLLASFLAKRTDQRPTSGVQSLEGLRGLVTGADPRALGLGGIAREQDALRAEIERLRNQVEQLRRATTTPSRTPLEEPPSPEPQAPSDPVPSPPSTATDPDRAEDLISRWLTPPEPPPPPPEPPPPVGILGEPTTPPLRGDSPNAAQLPPLQIRTYSAPATQPSPPPGAQQRPPSSEPYLPAGTILSGVLLTGLDAPTRANASADPLPVLTRIRLEAILPSRLRADVREAFVIGACYGDMASERAYCRAERLSMVRRDGQVIDTPLAATWYGEDGRVGIRGRLVSKQGQAIAKALLAGFADAASRAFGGGSLVVGSLGGFDRVPVEGLAAGGVASAMDRIAKYYLQLAEQMYPVVEVPAGRSGVWILTRGVHVALRP